MCNALIIWEPAESMSKEVQYVDFENVQAVHVVFVRLQNIKLFQILQNKKNKKMIWSPTICLLWCFAIKPNDLT